jgi:hypothetical protein
LNSPPPKPEVILTNFFAEPTVLLVPITSRVIKYLTISSEQFEIDAKFQTTLHFERKK